MAEQGKEIVIEPGTSVGETAVPAIVPRAPALTPMEMLSRAVENGQSIDVLDKLMGLQERYEANQGRKAFNAAIADAKAQIKPVTKNRDGHNSKYADMAAYAKEVDPILAAHNLSYRFRTKQEGSVTVTCILAHRDGHFEETTLSAEADKSGNKNSIQAIGSTLSYLCRYTLIAALGLASELDDDDGRSAGGDEPISEDELVALRARIDETKADAARLCETLKVDALPDLRKSQLKAANALLDERAKLLAKKRKEPAQ